MVDEIYVKQTSGYKLKQVTDSRNPLNIWRNQLYKYGTGTGQET